MQRSPCLALLLALSSPQETAPTRLPFPPREVLAELPPDGGPEFNRLVFEDSPYLRQHARNPVDWYPWGPEAFARAKAEDKAIFLSIGYSTCHWCHVMEHESFEDPAVAQLMNQLFVCIKVDREERPDVDHVYMTVTQSITGRGGWPMTVLLTPEKRPFFAGTYFPKASRGGRKGMLDLLPELASVYAEKREAVEAYAKELTENLQRVQGPRKESEIGPGTLALARSQLGARYEPLHGGFGNAPKFPVPHNLLFLLQRHQRGEDPEALAMVEKTLDAMRRGGVYDQVGFGFHRYSTDARWFLPHFEKMLYDQALHVMAYTAAWQVTGKASYRRTAEEILTYVLRDMTSDQGGFYSAEDADSEGEEGLFYTWTLPELTQVLGKREAELYARVYGMVAEGNFQEEATRRKTGRNIPHLSRPLDAWAASLDLDSADLRARLERARVTLFEAREQRVHPLKDEKILTDWNGLMISAAAKAGSAFEEPRYIEAARHAADFCLEELRTTQGRLLKRHAGGAGALNGVLEDYAFLSLGLLDLYEATFELRYLEAAVALVERMIQDFADEEGGGFFLAASDVDDVLVRGKEIYDGALPSGNSVASLVLLRLGHLTGKTAYVDRAHGTMRAFPGVARSPGSHAMLMAAVDFAVGPTFEVVLAGDPAAESWGALLRAFRQGYVPHKVLVHRPAGEAPPVTRLVPYTAEQHPLDGLPTAYVCRDGTCRLPTSDIETALSFLDPAAWGD